MDNEDKALYKIYITTSNLKDAGTNQIVFMQIFGTRKLQNRKSEIVSIKFPLERSINNSKKFKKQTDKLKKTDKEPGQTDKFEIEETRLDKIKKIRILLNKL